MTRGRRRCSRRRRGSLGTFTGGLPMGLGSEADVTLALVRSRQVDTLTSDPTDVLLGALIHIWPAHGCKELVFEGTRKVRGTFSSQDTHQYTWTSRASASCSPGDRDSRSLRSG